MRSGSAKTEVAMMDMNGDGSLTSSLVVRIQYTNSLGGLSGENLQEASALIAPTMLLQAWGYGGNPVASAI